MATALPSYYHGGISLQQCEELLNIKNKNGAYLIRDSGTIHGAMCLCVYKDKVVYTYRILKTHTGYYTITVESGLQEIFFKTLDELIHHYKKRNRGLATHLRYSVKRTIALAIEGSSYEHIQPPSQPSTLAPRRSPTDPCFDPPGQSPTERYVHHRQSITEPCVHPPRHTTRQPHAQPPTLHHTQPDGKLKRKPCKTPKQPCIQPDAQPPRQPGDDDDDFDEVHDYENVPDSPTYVTVLPS